MASLNAVLKKDDVTAKLVDSFMGLIAERVLTPGCKFLPERALAKRFGVSRSSLRHALKVLESMGVLVQRVGDGTYLNPNAAAILAKPMQFLILLEDISVQEFFELRLIVEPGLASLAADRATPEQLAILERALAGMKESSDMNEYASRDLDFHEAIFHASGNRAAALIFTMFHRAIWSGVAALFNPENVKRGMEEHEAIYSAIRDKQPREAQRKMTEHIGKAKDYLMRVSRSRIEALLAERIRPIRKD